MANWLNGWVGFLLVAAFFTVSHITPCCSCAAPSCCCLVTLRWNSLSDRREAVEYPRIKCIQGVLRKSIQKHEKTCPNHQYPLKFWQISVSNQPKLYLESMKMCPWTVSGRRSRPGGPQGALPGLPGNSKVDFWAESGAQGSHVGPHWVPKLALKSHFWG